MFLQYDGSLVYYTVTNVPPVQRDGPHVVMLGLREDLLLEPLKVHDLAFELGQVRTVLHELRHDLVALSVPRLPELVELFQRRHHLLCAGKLTSVTTLLTPTSREVGIQTVSIDHGFDWAKQ